MAFFLLKQGCLFLILHWKKFGLVLELRWPKSFSLLFSMRLKIHPSIDQMHGLQVCILPNNIFPSPRGSVPSSAPRCLPQLSAESAQSSLIHTAVQAARDASSWINILAIRKGKRNNNDLKVRRGGWQLWSANPLNMKGSCCLCKLPWRWAADADGSSADRRTDLHHEQEILSVATGVGSSGKQSRRLQ